MNFTLFISLINKLFAEIKWLKEFTRCRNIKKKYILLLKDKKLKKFSFNPINQKQTNYFVKSYSQLSLFCLTKKRFDSLSLVEKFA